MTLALPALPQHANAGHGRGHLFTEPMRGAPRPLPSQRLPTPLQPDMAEYFERDTMPPPHPPQALKSSACPPTSSPTNSSSPAAGSSPSSSPDIDLRPLTVSSTPPSFQQHPGVLRLELQAGEVDIPPAFYPGATIPFSLGLDLAQARRVGSLKLNLVGTLRTPHTTRVVVNIVTDLPCGASQWQRVGAAREAAPATTATSAACDAADAAHTIPAGQYRQGVYVQIPRQGVLPPSVRGLWGLAYAFRLVLCPPDVAWTPGMRAGDLARCLVAERAVEILPATLPEPAPLLVPHSFWIHRPHSPDTDRWTARLALPTTAFSPSATVPLALHLACPRAQLGHDVALTLSLAREEMVTTRVGPGSTSESSWTTVRSTRVLVRPQALEETYALALDLRGARGLAPTSSIEVGAAADKAEDEDECIWSCSSGNASLTVRSQYKLCLHLEFFAGSRYILIPVTIGSVAEPRDAVRQYEWSELYFPPSGDDRTTARAADDALQIVCDEEEEREPHRDPTPVLVWGTEEGSEDGWLVPPPSYREALDVVPYVYDATV